MNKKELIDRVFQGTEMTKKEIDLVLTKVLETIMITVSHGEKVQLVGFGSFSRSKKNLDIKGEIKCNIKFSAGKFFKQKVNLP